MGALACPGPILGIRLHMKDVHQKPIESPNGAGYIGFCINCQRFQAFTNRSRRQPLFPSDFMNGAPKSTFFAQ
jgi:hypothetical protein